jgi:hypothetical protein
MCRVRVRISNAKPGRKLKERPKNNSLARLIKMNRQLHVSIRAHKNVSKPHTGNFNFHNGIPFLS